MMTVMQNSQEVAVIVVVAEEVNHVDVAGAVENRAGKDSQRIETMGIHLRGHTWEVCWTLFQLNLSAPSSNLLHIIMYFGQELGQLVKQGLFTHGILSYSLKKVSLIFSECNLAAYLKIK